MLSFDGSASSGCAVKVQVVVVEHTPSLSQGTTLEPFDQMMSARLSPS
ncbi:hypothetical protein [Dyella sp.]